MRRSRAASPDTAAGEVKRRTHAQATATRRDGAAAAERAVLTAISGVKGRGKSGLSEDRLAAFEDAIERLEADGGVPVRSRDVAKTEEAGQQNTTCFALNVCAKDSSLPTLNACVKTHSQPRHCQACCRKTIRPLLEVSCPGQKPGTAHTRGRDSARRALGQPLDDMLRTAEQVHCLHCARSQFCRDSTWRDSIDITSMPSHVWLCLN